MHDAFMWNLSYNALFILLCINVAILDEIPWPMVDERATLAFGIQDFLGCIKSINKTLIKICKPWNNVMYKTWFNNMKKVDLMDNIMVCDHQGLVIYINTKYLGLYCDVTILWHFNINCNWPKWIIISRICSCKWLFQIFS